MSTDRTLIDQVIAFVDRPQFRKVLILLSVLMAGVMYLKVIKPAMDEKTKLIADTTQTQQQTASKRAELETLRSQLSKGGGQDLSKGLIAALPKDVQADYQLKLLTALGEAAGVNIQNFEPGTPTPSGSFQKLSIPIQVTCPIERCLRLLGGLHNLVQVNGSKLDARGPLWFVDQLSLAPAEAGKLSLTLTSGIFLAGDAAATAPAAGGTPAASTTTPPATTP